MPTIYSGINFYVLCRTNTFSSIFLQPSSFLCAYILSLTIARTIFSCLSSFIKSRQITRWINSLIVRAFFYCMPFQRCRAPHTQPKWHIGDWLCTELRRRPSQTMRSTSIYLNRTWLHSAISITIRWIRRNRAASGVICNRWVGFRFLSFIVRNSWVESISPPDFAFSVPFYIQKSTLSHWNDIFRDFNLSCSSKLDWRGECWRTTNHIEWSNRVGMHKILTQ